MKRIYYLLPIAGLLSLPTQMLAQKQTGSETILVNDSITLNLPEVFVKAERPLVKMTDGKLQYDIPNLMKSKPVDNAFDILGELPGVGKSGDNISLLGTSETTIIINGRKSSMTSEQLADMLKATPSSKVKKIEVMYSTPPQYGVRGASINVVIENDRSLADILKGEISLTGKQAWYFSPTALMNLSYTGKKYAADLSYSANYRHGRSTEDMHAEPTVNGTKYDILQKNWSENKGISHNLRGAFEYDFSNKDKLSASYTGKYVQDKPVSLRGGQTDFKGIETVNTTSRTTGPSFLHSTRIDYNGHKNLNAGIDYTFYKDKSLQDLVNNFEDSNDQDRRNESKQKSQRANIYINHFVVVGEGWKISYGAEASLSGTTNEASALLNNEKESEGTFYMKQKEHSAGIFGGFSRSFGKKFTLNASLAVHYYKASVDSAGKKGTLWDQADLFPSLSAVYRINRSNMLQFSLSSNRKYPSYWATTPNTYYMNIYSVIKGNPQLKPELNYSMQLTYVIKNKYVLGAFANFQPDKIQQMSYQQHDRLQSVFHSINLDTHTMYGLMAVVPFRAGEVLSSRLTLMGFSIHDKGTLVDISFDRKKLFGRAMLTNTIFLTRDKNLSLDISGDYSSPAIQGIYDIDPLYSLDAALVWTLPKKRLRLTLKGSDLLNSQKPLTHIDEQRQKSRMELFQDIRSVSLTLRYSFGGYKEKKVKSVDTSRFGT
ncbi:TonB-dependent receptor [Parabacteroides goldsteinii]|uniref:TonB-dependent receptor domain-containing protein n=1 Tax=Parabacteroides goldsteinii TaxID=328812 RepID=UPI001CC9B4E0|nr:TonB-dependent receptor [Parabacteroides goldsteinii]UBD77054.1 TonB-dependent receptor [Parabacteroides goldsteinii]